MALARPVIVWLPPGPVTTTLIAAGSVGASCAAKEKVSPVSRMVPGRTASGTTKASIAWPWSVRSGPSDGPPFAPSEGGRTYVSQAADPGIGGERLVHG